MKDLDKAGLSMGAGKTPKRLARVLRAWPPASAQQLAGRWEAVILQRNHVVHYDEVGGPSQAHPSGAIGNVSVTHATYSMEAAWSAADLLMETLDEATRSPDEILTGWITSRQKLVTSLLADHSAP